jgi:hypothetical protein
LSRENGKAKERPDWRDERQRAASDFQLAMSQSGYRTLMLGIFGIVMEGGMEGGEDGKCLQAKEQDEHAQRPASVAR